ncbi:MAG: S-layer homology domain-containing protein, partial [Clostridia bacterium]|nr:S-layer homology domain-containing protein [Clostridia bacterium]
AARDTLWVTGLAEGLSTLQSSLHCHGEGVVSSTAYEKITVPIDNPSITSAVVRNYDIISKYNDTTEIIIAGSNYSDESMRPKMLLYVNGSPRYYSAKSSATVRTGQYMNEPYDFGDELKVRMFGDFLGDETYRAMLLFDFADIKETDVVSQAELVFYAKKSTSYSEPKEFYVLRNPNAQWNEDTVSWSNLTTYVHNYNGVPGGNTWKNVSGADVEYAFQCCRFSGYRSMMTEYLYTKDESYSYAMVKNIMDFINDSEYGHPRTLDTACRLSEWVSIFDYLVDIKYVDADICTAILKTFYNDIQVGLNSTSPTANWIQTERKSAYSASALFPEFTSSENAKEKVVEFYTDSILNDFYPDGAYIEDTGGYNELALDDNYINVRSFIVEAGGSVPKEFDETIHKAAYYNMMLRGPAGEDLGYGDNGSPGGPNKSQRYSLLSQWYNDYELQFIGSYGAKGTEPDYTSVHLPDSTYTFMRSEWSDDALYLFTNVRGGGAHGHYDDNSLIVMGNGQHLLTDAGYVTYSVGADRNLAVSTKMHNTVSINDENHNHVTDLSAKYGNQGDVHSWTTNSEYDVLSQTTKGYTHIDNSHRRTITFLKSGFWIVSDLMIPDNKSKINNYKQNWHMLPTSNAYVSEDGVISTAFKTGGNIKLASPDNDSEIVQTEGVTTSTYGQPEAAPWIYYEKNASGNVSFDTVLLPHEGTSATLKAERIELGVPTDKASAMKFTAATSLGTTTTHYLLDYENSSERTFGKYKSDGFVTVVTEDKHGNITQLLLNDGTGIKTSSGKILVDFGQKVTDASVELEGNIIKIVTSDSGIDLSKVKINAFEGFTAVTVNGKYMDYSANGTLVTLSGQEGEEVIVNDKNANLGIKDKTDSSQGGSAGSDGIGGGTVAPVEPSQNQAFSDISDHWANNYIRDAYAKGYVNGYSDGTYRPDNNVSRAEFAALICRSFGLTSVPYDGAFADVDVGQWYTEYVSTALANGIISADAYFRPHDTITREEMCKMLAIAMQNSDSSLAEAEYSPAFSDMNTISDWAAEYVAYVCYHNIMNGRADGSFAPKESSTRAEAATVFSRLFQ